jgi:hypothetical protein
MHNEMITITAYCAHHHTEPSFIDALEKGGLLTITVVNEERFIDYEQLQQLECYTRWYYDMDINVPGIDAINNLLQKVKQMQQQIEDLKHQLALYRPGNASL